MQLCLSATLLYMPQGDIRKQCSRLLHHIKPQKNLLKGLLFFKLAPSHNTNYCQPSSFTEPLQFSERWEFLYLFLHGTGYGWHTRLIIIITSLAPIPRMSFVVSLIVLPTISDKRAHALLVGMLFSAGRGSSLACLPPRLALSRLVMRDSLGSAVKCIVFDFPLDFSRRLQVANFAIRTCDVVHVPFWLLRHFTFGLWILFWLLGLVNTGLSFLVFPFFTFLSTRLILWTAAAGIAAGVAARVAWATTTATARGTAATAAGWWRRLYRSNGHHCLRGRDQFGCRL